MGIGKIKELKNKLQLTFLYIGILIVLWCFKVPCLFKHFCEIECIGCGMTRAVLSALKFDFASAFAYHSMFWSIPILYIYFLYDGKVFGKKIIDLTVLITIAIGFVLNWVLKLV
jgi:hypothetical protein